MTTLKFADTHNMVAFLSKPAESEGFEQIVDFLNANPIRYALTINPTIYTSCIQQFWATVKVKTVNGEVQLQALVDGKKIIITESTVRRDLQLEDAEGVDCLPNATIFEQLTLMGYEKISQKLTFYKAFFSPQWKFLIHTILQCLSSKTTAWNEFSSTMASAIICLATNQKFNFSKYIFESMVKNLDNAGKFLMYPRFVQVFLDKQLEGMSNHNRIYVTLSHTKKIFGNMRRVGKVFSRRETPLFQTMVVQAQEEIGEGSANPTDPHYTPTIIQPSTSQPQKKQKPRKTKRKDTQIPPSSSPTDNVADEAANEEIDDSLERAATTATSLDAKQDRGNINKTQSKAKTNETGSQGTTSDGGPKCQETRGDTIAQTRVLDLETTKTTQANEIARLKRRVKKLEIRNKSRTYRLKRMYRVGSSRRVKSSKDEDLGKDVSKQGRRINAIDADEDITLVNDQDDADMFDVNDLDGDEVIVDNVHVVKTATITDVEITLAQALAELKSVKPKADKGKVIMIEEPVMEQVKPIKRLEQIRLDEELLAQRLQAQEKEELTDEEKAKLFVQFLEQRRKYFTAKRAEEKRNGPLTRAQQRSIMCTYRKNMEGWKPKNLKNMSFANIQELFDKAMKKVNTFVDYRTELVEESSKKAEAEIAQESKVVSDDEEEVAIDVVPLATKPPTIVDWKIHKEEKKSYYQIIKANGKSQMYRVFSQMLKSFSREDLKDLYKLGRIVRIKRLLDDHRVTAAKVYVTAAKLKTQFTDYGFQFDKIPMYCDSKADIAISCNPVQHSYTKHIDVKYHFIKEQVENGIVELFFVRTEYQLADLFTKALSEDRFKYLIKRIGMRCLTPEELEVLANESA
ncbi:hypothetical protein Tco_0296817 [Tanacetum coccineum]